ncbi:GntR family transcriptional regulator [Methylobacterium terricola]|uniref:GntR family transcriptional regulator n=1 Tax=Methylobacterium terricola TaxID=2583531 RepID=A0A5C4LMJ3_9HYPH|nr:GntR family transcriptional regulator [Methylobacterium terricola]TNC14476.1 GntR family transcriptional regulator [Methylobacterium terricola]
MPMIYQRCRPTGCDPAVGQASKIATMNETPLQPVLATSDSRLAQHAYEQVLGLIMSRQIAPGTLLQERRLAEYLKMSRTPLRDALLMLEAEGLLVRQGSRGLQVKAMNIGDFIDNLSIRILLEPEATRAATPHVSKDVCAEVTARLETLVSRACQGEVPDRAEVREIDERLHSMILDAAANSQMTAIIRTLRRQTQIFDLRSLPERFESTCREHLAITAAIGGGQADEAASAMRRHLESVKQSIVTRLG